MICNRLREILNERATVVKASSKNIRTGKIYLPSELVGRKVVWLTVEELQELIREIESLRREHDNCKYKLSVIGDILIARAKELEKRLSVMKLQLRSSNP